MPYHLDREGLSGDGAVEFDFIEEQPDEDVQQPYPTYDNQEPRQSHQIRAEAAGG